MNWITVAIRQPVTVIVGVILTILAGLLAIQRVPIQLTPNVEDTIIAVTTHWEGASPQEVEQEVVDKQEDKLQGLANLKAFIDAGGVFLASNSSAEFAINNFTYGVSVNRPGAGSRVVGSLLRTRLVDDRSPLAYGIPDQLAMHSDSGESFTVSANVGGAGRGCDRHGGNAGDQTRFDTSHDPFSLGEWMSGPCQQLLKRRLTLIFNRDS